MKIDTDELERYERELDKKLLDRPLLIRLVDAIACGIEWLARKIAP
jgi:hypothetical protein